MRTEPTRPGRPRDAGVEARVLTAAAGLLAEAGYDRLRVDAVARRSGVAKTTIYRRWPSLAALAVAAHAALLGERAPEPTGDVLADLDALLAAAFRVFDAGHGASFAIGVDLARQDDPELARVYRTTLIDPLRTRAITLIERGVAAGLLRPALPPADLVDAWAGAALFRRLIVGEPLDEAGARAFATALLNPQVRP